MDFIPEDVKDAMQTLLDCCVGVKEARTTLDIDYDLETITFKKISNNGGRVVIERTINCGGDSVIGAIRDYAMKLLTPLS